MNDFKYHEPSGEGWDYPAEPRFEHTCPDCGFGADELFDVGKRRDVCSICAEETHVWCEDCHEYHKKFVACPYSGDIMEVA